MAYPKNVIRGESLPNWMLIVGVILMILIIYNSVSP